MALIYGVAAVPTNWFEAAEVSGTITPTEPEPVGGALITVNKFESLVPWIGLASLVTVVAAAIVYVNHRKRQQT